LELNPCDSHPCHNGGTCCPTTRGKFRCDCPRGFKGKTCDIVINPCDRHPCHNGGICYPTTRGRFRCDCPRGFKGKTCDIGL
ncbi:hypothetical protein LOTGIDRAFT_147989, partial [Lottia gigantea]